MAAETDLARLLAGLDPELDPRPLGYAFVLHGQALPQGLDFFALVREAEGMTVIAELDVLATAGLLAQGRWARITMRVHSALDAVGMTAAMATALSRAGISANVVAAYNHDHLLVPWERRDDAMAVLKALAKSAGA